MNTEAMIIIVAVLIAVAGAVWHLKRTWGRHRLRGADRSAVVRKLEILRMQKDPFRRLMEADAILDDALRRLGYRGSLGEKLQRAGPYVLDIEEVWKSHKLRNRLAHEPGQSHAPTVMLAAAETLERAIARFCS